MAKIVKSVSTLREWRHSEMATEDLDLTLLFL